MLFMLLLISLLSINDCFSLSPSPPLSIVGLKGVNSFVYLVVRAKMGMIYAWRI